MASSTLAERVALALTEAGKTQADMARGTGIKPPSISDWVSGKTKSLKGASLLKAAAFLKVNEKWLSEGVGPMRKPNPLAHEPAGLVLKAVNREYGSWPFKLVTRARLENLTEEALKDIDEHLDLVASKWEGRQAASGRKQSGPRA